MTLRLISTDPAAEESFDEKMHRLSMKLADDALLDDNAGEFRLDAFKVLGNYQVQQKRLRAPPAEDPDTGFSFDDAKRRLTQIGEEDGGAA